VKKTIALIFALITMLSFCACGDDSVAANPYEKYAKYDDLFECLEAGDYESAQSYLQDFFGITVDPTEPTEPPTEPTEPPTEPTEPPTEPTEPPTEPTEPPTEPTEPPTEPTEPPIEPEEKEELVWIPQSGTKYHSRPNCSNMKDPTQVTKEEAEAAGYTPCKRCH
jgi:outer membrane biosynthesis protein TonB